MRRLDLAIFACFVQTSLICSQLLGVLMMLSEGNYTCDYVQLLVKSQLSSSVSELQNGG